jgi:hypothetical protein
MKFQFIINFTVINGRLSAKFRRSVAIKTDQRSKVMTQIVMAIRVIKMYGWEMPFASIIRKIRK